MTLHRTRADARKELSVAEERYGRLWRIARVKITEVGSRDTQAGARRRLEMQITDMALGDDPEAPSATKVLYGEGG